MELSILTPPKPPSREAGSGRAATSSRDLLSDYGSGFEQRAPDGINTLTRTIPLIWAYLAGSDADALCGAFDGYGRSKAFAYTLPWESAPRKFRIGGALNSPLYIRDQGRGLTVRVEVTLQEVFDLDPISSGTSAPDAQPLGMP